MTGERARLYGRAVRILLAVLVAVLALGDTSAMAAKKRPALLDYVPAAPTVHYTQGVAPGDRVEQAISGGAAYQPETDTIYFSGPPLTKFARGHENGHALDDQVLGDGDRHYFTRLMGLTGDWNQGTGLTAGGLRSPNEFFADWYGNAATGSNGRTSWNDAYAPAPDPKQFRRFMQALDRLGHRKGLLPYG